MIKALILLAVGLVLTGCGSSEVRTGGKESQSTWMGAGSANSGRYSIKQDRGPERPVNLAHVQDAVPRYEPKSRGGNKSPYRVLGKTYYVMPSAEGYRERGTASWYGKKFHGHKTSNGETYDMYSMSAAHKALPLPTFLRVTNLDNGRQVIVRVNDRGPFHGKRLIDLSYAAASKLDMLGKGTARVELEAITPGRLQAVSPQVRVASIAPVASAPVIKKETNSAPAGRYIQIGAFSTAPAAASVQQDARGVVPELPVWVVPVNVSGTTLYRVQLGPLVGSYPVQSAVDLLERAGYTGVHLVDLNLGLE